MKLYSVVSSINYISLLEEYKKLEENIPWPEKSAKGRQCGLQYADGEDYSKSAVGRLESGRLETEYKNINPIFKNTIFETIIKEHNMFRSRLMWVNPFSCYSIHRDTSQRLHIPMITNTDCLFVFPNHQKLFHLPAGSVYIVDTTKHHSFCNFSETPRLHLMGCVAD